MFFYFLVFFKKTFLSKHNKPFSRAYLTPPKAWHVPQIIPANRFPFSFLPSVRPLVLAAILLFVCNDFQFLTSRLWNNIISKQTSLYSYTAKTKEEEFGWDEFFTRLYSSIKNLNRSISFLWKEFQSGFIYRRCLKRIKTWHVQRETVRLNGAHNRIHWKRIVQWNWR